MKLDVSSAMHFIAEAWTQITPTTTKNCFVKCGFSNDLVSSNDDTAVKLGEDDNWHSLEPLGVQFEDHTCDSGLDVCGIQTVDQVSDQHLTRPEEEDEVSEHIATYLDALKGLEGAIWYTLLQSKPVTVLHGRYCPL
jgi:hypothetical protein